jgi:GMP synthase (glutamine-hydrolysing)
MRSNRVKHDLLIVKTGSTFSSLMERRGDFEDWLVAPLGIDRSRIRIVHPREGDDLPDAGDVSGVIITGSHAMVTDRYDWSDRIAAWLPGVVEAGIPLLGICYGHQLLAVAMGGEADDNPSGSTFGTVEVRFTGAARDDLLLGGLGSVLRVHVTHTQSVLKLPPGAVLLAETDNDPHHAFSIGEAAWSLQFHPEFDADVVEAYIEKCAEHLRGQGQDPEALKKTVEDNPWNEKIMRRFGEIVMAGRDRSRVE